MHRRGFGTGAPAMAWSHLVEVDQGWGRRAGLTRSTLHAPATLARFLCCIEKPLCGRYCAKMPKQVVRIRQMRDDYV